MTGAWDAIIPPARMWDIRNPNNAEPWRCGRDKRFGHPLSPLAPASGERGEQLPCAELSLRRQDADLDRRRQLLRAIHALRRLDEVLVLGQEDVRHVLLW